SVPTRRSSDLDRGRGGAARGGRPAARVRLAATGRAPGLARRPARPPVLERHDAVEDEIVPAAVDGVAPEVAEALELVAGVGVVVEDRGLDQAAPLDERPGREGG